MSGVEELVDEGRNGWFVPRDGAADRAAATQLRDDPALRAALGEAARESSARYTWDGVVDAYVKLYASLATRAAARHQLRHDVQPAATYTVRRTAAVARTLASAAALPLLLASAAGGRG